MVGHTPKVPGQSPLSKATVVTAGSDSNTLLYVLSGDFSESRPSQNLLHALALRELKTVG